MSMQDNWRGNLWRSVFFSDDPSLNLLSDAAIRLIATKRVILAVDSAEESIWSSFCKSYLPRVFLSNRSNLFQFPDPDANPYLDAHPSLDLDNLNIEQKQVLYLARWLQEQGAVRVHDERNQSPGAIELLCQTCLKPTHIHHPGLWKLINNLLRTTIAQSDSSQSFEDPMFVQLLRISIDIGTDDLTEELLKRGVDPFLRSQTPLDKISRSAIESACYAGTTVRNFAQILEHAVPGRLDDFTESGEALMHVLVLKHGSKSQEQRQIANQKLGLLLSKGVKVDLPRKSDQATALLLAAKGNSSHAAMLLLENGAKPGARNNRGFGIGSHILHGQHLALFDRIATLVPESSLWVNDHTLELKLEKRPITLTKCSIFYVQHLHRVNPRVETFQVHYGSFEVLESKRRRIHCSPYRCC